MLVCAVVCYASVVFLNTTQKWSISFKRRLSAKVTLGLKNRPNHRNVSKTRAIDTFVRQYANFALIRAIDNWLTQLRGVQLKDK
jgi:hypothetical protein